MKIEGGGEHWKQKVYFFYIHSDMILDFKMQTSGFFCLFYNSENILK